MKVRNFPYPFLRGQPLNMSVLNGSTQLALRWNYTLPAGVVISTTFSIRLNDGSFDDIAMIFGGNITVRNYY